MVFGPGENKMEGQKKLPILLSFALIMDFLIIGFSVALILLILSIMMVLSLFATFFAWITSMFGGIYSMAILFGKKYNWPCCPQLKNQIQKELLGSPFEDEKNKNVEIEV